jgi:uncharacterized protein YaeQ
MKLILFFFAIGFSTIFQAQNENELKSFINKNSIAISSIQKNMFTKNDLTYSNQFKELLMNQIVAVKQFMTHKEISCYYAFLVRDESLKYLTKNNSESLEYFKITLSENTMIKSNPINKIKLSVNELKVIQNLDVLNPSNLNQFTLTVQ